jgi:hypothetical protein
METMRSLVLGDRRAPKMKKIMMTGLGSIINY